MSFPREKHQSILVDAMSAAFSVSVWHGEGWPDALRAASAADLGRATPLFATENTRLHTENRTQGALQFFTKFKNSLQQTQKFSKIFRIWKKPHALSSLGSVFNKNGLPPRREEWQWAMRSVPSLWHPRAPPPPHSDTGLESFKSKSWKT